ncbi:MAG: hypothetical protein GF353_21520 [Candidatus Lokiarchaeota archaeon]|nr:hypothetical protein [Candidatus Lokiarchaeota archaeon]
MNKRIEEVYKWGLELSEFSPRIPGTKNIEKTKDYIVDKLRNFGLKVWLEPINFRGVFFHDWEFSMIEPEYKTITSCPQNNVGFGDVKAEIIDIGKGTDKDYTRNDVKGKLVLINWGTLADHEAACGFKKRYPLLASYDKAWINDVAGMVGYFEDTPGNSLKILEPGIKPMGGSNVPGPAEFGEKKQFKLPVLHIGKEDAEKLKKLIKNKKVKAELKIKGKRKISTVSNIIGLLPGLKKGTILIGAHYCTTFSGAICDTTGVVGALELARVFSELPLKKRRKSMIFIFSGSHVWLNCNISSLWFIEKHKKFMPNITAMLWMDHISDAVVIKGQKIKREKFPARLGLTTDNFVVFLLTYAAMFKNKRFPLVLPLSRIWTLCEMGPFDNIGIPCMCMQVMNHVMLTTEDTWDKIDPLQLYRDISVYIDMARAIHTIPGKIMKAFEFRGRSFFGCGALFKTIKQPKYNKGEHFIPEEAPNLLIGGQFEPIYARKPIE